MNIFINNYQNNYPKINFKAMKKAQFSGIDFFVVEKYKLPIEKFNGMNDLKNYCKKIVEMIKNQDFGGRKKETNYKRKIIINEWYEYLTKNPDKFSYPAILMVLKAITKDIKPNDDKLPPILHINYLLETMNKVAERLNIDKKSMFDFKKEYEQNFRDLLNVNEKTSGWIVIPSRQHDPENFHVNTEILKTLSLPEWCTKSGNAEPYLEEGDFHIYLNKGIVTFGIRFIGDGIEEIQREYNDRVIPIQYYDLINEHIKDYPLLSYAKSQMEQLNRFKAERDAKVKKIFPKGLENYSTKEILETFKIRCKVDEDGKLIISHFEEPFHNMSYTALGIDENKLFDEIKIIEGNANFSNCEATTLGNLEEVRGNADFWFSEIVNTGKLKKISGNASFNLSKLTSLFNIEEVGGNLSFSDVKNMNVKNLRRVGGNLYMADTTPVNYNNLKEVGGNIYRQQVVVNQNDLPNIKIGGKII